MKRLNPPTYRGFPGWLFAPEQAIVLFMFLLFAGLALLSVSIYVKDPFSVALNVVTILVSGYQIYKARKEIREQRRTNEAWWGMISFNPGVVAEYCQERQKLKDKGELLKPCPPHAWHEFKGEDVKKGLPAMCVRCNKGADD